MTTKDSMDVAVHILLGIVVVSCIVSGGVGFWLVLIQIGEVFGAVWGPIIVIVFLGVFWGLISWWAE